MITFYNISILLRLSWTLSGKLQRIIYNYQKQKSQLQFKIIV